MLTHADPTRQQRVSQAPYNFVPLPEAVFTVTEGLDVGGNTVKLWKCHDQFVPGTYSGWIGLRITAETPLYVRCGPAAAEVAQEPPNADLAELARDRRYRQDFFHHGNKEWPVIPGSSLRGMARALVEILASAKMQWFDNRRLIYRAVGDTTSLGNSYRAQLLGPQKPGRYPMHYDYPSPNVKGGYLVRKGLDWYIQPAKTIEGETFIHVDYKLVESQIGRPGRQRVHKVWVQPVARKTTLNRGEAGITLDIAETPRAVFKEEHGLVRAWLVESGHMGARSHPKHMHCAIYEADKTAPLITIPREMREMYDEDKRLPRGDNTPTRPLGSDNDPLFYLTDERDGLVFFGPTMMFRLPYTHTIGEFVPKELRRATDLDLAEAIFGTVDRKPAIKGRVFFEDAPWDSNGGNPFLEEGDAGLRSPRILSAPKPTSFQHYLVQDNPDDRNDLRHWASDPTARSIRGHKRYWHKKDATHRDRFEDSLVRDSQHTVIRPVREGRVFCGRLRFENLSALELGALLAALDLPETMRHHVGMGKPLGMGSVKIDVEPHLINRHERYSSLLDESGKAKTGELSKAEAKDETDSARKYFRKEMVQHYNASSQHEIPRDRDIWTIPRLAQLATLLEWDKAPTKSRTSYVNPTEGEIGRLWRQRPVLPTPKGVYGTPSVFAAASPARSAPPRGQQPATVSHGPSSSPKVGDRVRCVLLSEKTKRGGWRARLRDGSAEGHILSQNEPSVVRPGQEVTLVVQAISAADGSITFAWPSSASG